MKEIKTIIIEEHHESFLCWYMAIQDNTINASDNLLLHVDSHADMKISPHLIKIPEINAGIDEVKDFVYKELRLSDFIIPALYRKIFNEFCWLMPLNCSQLINDSQIKNEKYHLRSFKNEDKILILTKDGCENIKYNYFDGKIFFYTNAISVADSFDGSRPVILDVDLDYFCCSKLIDQSCKIEITKDQFDLCNSDKYSKLNLFFRYNAKIEDDKYYLILNANPTVDMVNNEHDLNQIDRSIEDFTAFLIKNNIKIDFITICRSRHSGFTPEKYWEYIEKKFLNALKKTYNIKYLTLSEFIG